MPEVVLCIGHDAPSAAYLGQGGLKITLVLRPEEEGPDAVKDLSRSYYHSRATLQRCSGDELQPDRFARLLKLLKPRDVLLVCWDQIGSLGC